MLKTSFKSFYYIFCSKLILDLIYIFLGRLSMSLGGPPARSRWLGPKRADKIDGWAQKGRTKSLVKKRRTTGFEPRPQGKRACALPLYYSTVSVLWRKIKVYIIIMEGPWYTWSYLKGKSVLWYLLLLQSMQQKSTLRSGTMCLCSRIGSCTSIALRWLKLFWEYFMYVHSPRPYSYLDAITTIILWSVLCVTLVVLFIVS